MLLTVVLERKVIPLDMCCLQLPTKGINKSLVSGAFIETKRF
jgi:hypothetical protein